MKIAWFSPFRKVSAIGRFSRLVTENLAGDADVDLWVPESRSDELHETDLHKIHFRQLPDMQHFLSRYDIIVYNLGDQAEYHGQIFEISRQIPGIVILHDFVMHHFFAVYYHNRNAWDEYARIMKRWYGVDLTLTPAGWQGETWRVWERDEVVCYPLFEETVQGSLGVVTHAEFVNEAVRRVTATPVTKIPLAYAVDRSKSVLSRAELLVPEDRVLVITIGHANPNKRIQAVMETLAAKRDLAQSVYYAVIGGAEGPMSEGLAELRNNLALQDSVRLTGFVSDEVLHSFLAHAEICINLRWPAMEGGSASCAEQMLFGKATIVTDTGVYSELPDACVLKVRPDHETQDLTAHLSYLVADREIRKALGEEARAFAEANFSPKGYARELLTFCAEVVQATPVASLTAVVGRELRNIGVNRDMDVINHVVEQVDLLINGDYEPPILRQDS